MEKFPDVWYDEGFVLFYLWTELDKQFLIRDFNECVNKNFNIHYLKIINLLFLKSRNFSFFYW